MRAKMCVFATVICLTALPAHGNSSSSPDQVLEQHYDSYLTAEMPFLGHGLDRIGRHDIPVGSSPYEPFVETTTTIWESGAIEISGQTKKGPQFDIIFNTNGHRAWMRFLRNGSEEYRMVVSFLKDGNAFAGINSSLKYLADPSRNINISVRPLTELKTGHERAAQLTIKVNGHTFSERIWPGKKRLESLGELKSALAERSTRYIPLHNYFSLMVNSPIMVSQGLAVLDEALRFPEFGSPSETNGRLLKDIDGSEGYWCAVGSAGADLVTSAVGSFGYGVVCGLIAEAS